MEFPNKKIEKPPVPGTPESKAEKPPVSEISEKEEVPKIEKEPAPAKVIPQILKRPLFKKAEPVILEKSETLQEIEKILTEGLEDIYQDLPEMLKEKFRKRGEEAASKIERLIATVKINVKKVLSLIKNWLKIIPGVNRFFLEQESKIKTDKILVLAEKKRRKKIEI